ncbi:MAG: aspartyl beta-hydroxylase [Erysipelotrichaceae bacterium]|jgi:polyhydroxyalkanoate synthesis regulator phasin|nr:aspartyl beta-hydroxylase [Erysipelotrichaceae bacterium]
MDITEGLKKALLAGIGAAALTVEKSSEIVDGLVKKGEITVEQGKALNQELKHKAEEAKTEDKKETADFKDMVSKLSEEDLAKLKEAIKDNENKED